MHIGTFKHSTAVRVYYFTLFGDDVVIIDHVVTNVEVVALNFGLCALNEVTDEAAFQRRVLFHTNALHDLCHTIGREATHLQSIRKQIDEENKRLQVELDRLTALESVQKRATELGLQKTEPSNMVVVNDKREDGKKK